MKRVISLYLPTWPTDRLRRRMGDSAPPVDAPIALVGRVGRRRAITAVDLYARRLGISVGMPATQAQALIATLSLHDADTAEDDRDLEKLALWALRAYSPIAASDPPDGVYVEATGSAHLFGGEHAMLAHLLEKLSASGVAGRAAIAPTYGAAHALARFGASPIVIAPDDAFTPLLTHLPIAALRLPPDTVRSLRDLGFQTIGELNATPRAPIALRFGSQIGRRLDQAFGRVSEPIEPIEAPELVSIRRAFAEPISAPETLQRYTGILVDELCAVLEAKGLGAIHLDLIFHRIDNRIEAIRVGMAKPVREAKRLKRLLTDKLETVDPGFGVELMVLRAPFAEPLAPKQTGAMLTDTNRPDVSELIDTLANRIGAGRLYQAVALESDVPERSIGKAEPLADVTPNSWPVRWPRPARLLRRPEPIETMALLPDHPPANFTWRGVRRRVARADGPERIFGEWWKRDGEMDAVRDYFQVEDEAGERFWLFRAGDGETLESGSQRWFLHGLFA